MVMFSKEVGVNCRREGGRREEGRKEICNIETCDYLK